MYRACELSSGRRRHWKNRTEINRSVFFAVLEHRFPWSSSFFATFRLSCLFALPLTPSPAISLHRRFHLHPPTPPCSRTSRSAVPLTFHPFHCARLTNAGRPRSFHPASPGLLCYCQTVQDDYDRLSTPIRRFPCAFFLSLRQKYFFFVEISLNDRYEFHDQLLRGFLEELENGRNVCRYFDDGVLFRRENKLQTLVHFAIICPIIEHQAQRYEANFLRSIIYTK